MEVSVIFKPLKKYRGLVLSASINLPIVGKNRSHSRWFWPKFYKNDKNCRKTCKIGENYHNDTGENCQSKKFSQWQKQCDRKFENPGLLCTLQFWHIASLQRTNQRRVWSDKYSKFSKFRKVLSLISNQVLSHRTNHHCKNISFFHFSTFWGVSIFNKTNLQ